MRNGPARAVNLAIETGDIKRGSGIYSGTSYNMPVTNFNKALEMAIEAAGVERFGFHHTRHYFISHCVMAGIDYMTIAKWVGHQDGGILIGKVYGHLNNAHTAEQARKVRL